MHVANQVRFALAGNPVTWCRSLLIYPHCSSGTRLIRKDWLVVISELAGLYSTYASLMTFLTLRALKVFVVVVVSHISSFLGSSACGHKIRGSEGVLREQKKGPHQRVTNHKCRAPKGALLRRKRTLVGNKRNKTLRKKEGGFIPAPSTTTRGSNAGIARPGNGKFTPAPQLRRKALWAERYHFADVKRLNSARGVEVHGRWHPIASILVVVGPIFVVTGNK